MNTRRRKVLRLAHHGFKPPAAELPAQLRNDAERAGMIAALGNFDVCGVARRGQQARRGVMVKECGRRGRGGVQIALDGLEDAFELARADDRVHLWYLLADRVAIALHQAAGHDQAARPAKFLVLGHFEDGVDRLLLGGFDKAAGVDDDDVSFVGARRDLISLARENAHHHLAIHEVFRAA